MWDRISNQYEETDNNHLSGLWENESYSINIYQSGEQLVAFINTVIKGDKSWSKDQLKMIFGTKSGKGIYLMGNKTPMPAKLQVNKFGYIEIKLLTNSEIISFAKKP